MNNDFQEAKTILEKILEQTDWHQTLDDPNMTVKVIEAKAKIMEANKKLTEVLEKMKK